LSHIFICIAGKKVAAQERKSWIMPPLRVCGGTHWCNNASWSFEQMHRD